MIDPANHTVEEVKDWVREEAAGRGVATLRHLYERERDTKDRVTLTGWLESRIEDAEAVQVNTNEPAEDRARGAGGGRGRGPTAADADTPARHADDYDPDEHPYWLPGEVPNADEVPLVVVAPHRERGVAGWWFENARARVVPRNRRVDRAIVDGDLEYRGEAPDATPGAYV